MVRTALAGAGMTASHGTVSDTGLRGRHTTLLREHGKADGLHPQEILLQ